MEDGVRSAPDRESRARFLAIASCTVRRGLVDYERRQTATRRGGDRRLVTLDAIALERGAVLPGDRSDAGLALEASLARLEAYDPATVGSWKARSSAG